jgi:hypothetical protein
MPNIKHSKFKNSGIIFELLVRQITADALSGKNSPASTILKKYFVNTEIGKEYRLYETIFKYKNITESKANTILSTVLESSKKLSRTKLKTEKYNLIKELKDHYNLEDLFKTKLPEYKAYASLYTLIEIHNSTSNIDPSQMIDSKLNLIECLIYSPKDKFKEKNEILEEFKNCDKDVRVLTYRILLEKFNTKYDNLSIKQKNILKEFINSIDSTSQLKEFYNNEIKVIKKQLTEHISKTKNQVVKIKLQEISKFLVELNKNDKVYNDHLVDLLQYHDLINELLKIK